MKIPMIAEIDVATEEEAQMVLDAFREAVQPNNWGISLYRADEDGCLAVLKRIVREWEANQHASRGVVESMVRWARDGIERQGRMDGARSDNNG